MIIIRIVALCAIIVASEMKPHSLTLWKEEEVVREEVEEVEARRTRGGWWRMRRAPRPK